MTTQQPIATLAQPFHYDNLWRLIAHDDEGALFNHGKPRRCFLFQPGDVSAFFRQS